MAEISLRAYIDYIEDRLSRDAFTEVVAQCRHILNTYPKHIDTYRVLAKAIAAQENYTDALDLFQRVLSAVPDDFVAHVGMSECYKEDDALDQALWHLERAFEQAPGNADLQAEIKQMYQKRDGHAPSKIQMTGGALARMYVKGKLYDQAISELTKTLTHDPERLDLQVLLAQALWSGHQEVAAGRVAAEALKKLPYSLDANRLLAKLWLRAGEPAEARPFIERVKELDPYEGYQFEHNGESAPADTFLMSTLDFTAEAHAAQVGAADWVSEIEGIEKQKGVTGPLKEGGAITDIFAQPAAPPAPAPSIPSELPTPDWLKDALGLQGTVVAPTTPAPAGGTPAPEWLQDAMGGGKPPAPQPAMDANAPEWLKDVLQETPASSPPVTPAPAPSAGATAPGWLKDVLQETPASPPPVTPAPAPAGGATAPEWLKDVLQETPASPPPATPAPAPTAGANAPDWLKDVLVEQTPASVPPPGSQERQKPAWLEDILAQETPAVPPPAAKPAGPQVVTTDMLNKILSEGTPVLAQQPEGTPVPAAEAGKKDFNFNELGDLDTWDGPLPASVEVPPPPEGWLTQDTGLQPPKSEDKGEEDKPLPGWLTSAEPVAPKATRDLSEPEVEAGELPSWLQVETPVAKKEQAGAEAEPAKEALPDWLKGEAAPAPGKAEAEAQPEETKKETPDWLEGEAVPAPMPAAALEEEKKVAPPDQPTGDNASEEEVPDWLASGDLDSDDALKWLEEIAAKVDPNFKMSESSEAAPPTEAAAPTPAEAKAEVAEPAKAEDLEWLRTPTETKAPEKEEEEELPAWLKAEPEKPAAKAEPAPEAADALAWLDQQITGQGVPPGKPVSEALTPDHPPTAAPMPVPDLSAEAKPAAEEELPDWLREAGAKEEISKALEAPSAEAEMAELPELPVEADELAWLNEALKAEEQAAPGDLEAVFGEVQAAEKPSPAPAGEAKAEEAEELPAWLKGEEAPAPPQPSAEAKPAEAEELPAWLKAEEAPAPARAEPAAPTPPPVAVKPEEKVGEKAEELPDWLKAPAEPEAPGGTGLTAFLKAVEPAAPTTQALPTPPVSAAPPAPPVPVPPPAPAPTPVSAIPAGEADAQLKAARDQMAAGELQNALGIYEALVAGGHKQDEVLSDLTELTKTRVVVNPRVYRVMGDALMGKGKAPEALEMYRKALDSF